MRNKWRKGICKLRRGQETRNKKKKKKKKREDLEGCKIIC